MENGPVELCRPPASFGLPPVILEVRELVFHRRRRLFLFIAATAVLPLALSHALLSAPTVYPALNGNIEAPSSTTFLARSVFLLTTLLYSVLSVASLTRAATAEKDPTNFSEALFSLGSPGLWARLAATVLLGAAAHAGLHGITALAVALSCRALGGGTLLGLAAFLLICLAHVAALVAVGVARHLAAAACVLCRVDGAWGVDAFRISAALVRGREWEASAAFLAHHVPFAAAEAAFAAVLLARGDGWGELLGLNLRLACGAAAVLVMTAVLASGMTVAAVACAALARWDGDEEEAGVSWQVADYVLLKGHHHQVGYAA